MTPDPAATVASILQYIERCKKRNKPPRLRQFGREARIEGVDVSTGVISVTVATNGHAWRLRAFAGVNRLDVRVDAEKVADG